MSELCCPITVEGLTFGNLLLISMSTGAGLDVKMGSVQEEPVQVTTLSASVSIDAAEPVGNRQCLCPSNPQKLSQSELLNG